MLAPLNESVLPHSIRSRLVAGINGLTVHVLEAGFEMASASPAAGQEFRRAREAVLTRATYFAELCVSPRRVRPRARYAWKPGRGSLPSSIRRIASTIAVLNRSRGPTVRSPKPATPAENVSSSVRNHSDVGIAPAASRGSVCASTRPAVNSASWRSSRLKSPGSNASSIPMSGSSRARLA